MPTAPVRNKVDFTENTDTEALRLGVRVPEDELLPAWLKEPPTPTSGSLVPGSRFPEEAWVHAAFMLARGASFLQVARSMGCSRTTLWRAYYGSIDFRTRIWWERKILEREARAQLGSLTDMVSQQIRHAVSSGDMATVRWLADRMDFFNQLGRSRPLPDSPEQDRETPIEPIAGALPAPAAHDPPAALIAHLPESDGPRGQFPWTATGIEDQPDFLTVDTRRTR
ncbi:hypothetical protein [Azospirillum sp.]|uniref:hypothetical protein n=1 Tax=Azospirillum sp. TaxID=34012 RepID=UPI003D74ECA9